MEWTIVRIPWRIPSQGTTILGQVCRKKGISKPKKDSGPSFIYFNFIRGALNGICGKKINRVSITDDLLRVCI